MYKILRPIPGYAYFGGELVTTLPEGEPARLLNEGYLIVLPDTEGDEDFTVELPSDMPYREMLCRNGYVSLDDLPATPQELTAAVKEITPKRAATIYEFIKSKNNGDSK